MARYAASRMQEALRIAAIRDPKHRTATMRSTLDGGHSLFPGAAANASILLQLGPGDVVYAIRSAASDAVLSVLRAS